MNWHEHSAQDAVRELQVTPQAGLDAAEAAARQEKYGKNRIRAAGRRSTLQMFLEQFKDVMVLILLAAALISGPLESGWRALAPQTPEMQVSEAISPRSPCIRINQEVARGALCFAGRALG